MTNFYFLLKKELYKIDEEYGKEGGHVWFGDAINGKIPGQIMWDFLSNYTTND